MVLKNYDYVWVLTHVEPGDGTTAEEAWNGLAPESSIYIDENCLPWSVSEMTIRRARETPTEAIFSPGTMSFLTYCPIQGKSA